MARTSGRDGVRRGTVAALAALAFVTWLGTAPGRAAGFFEKNFWLSGPRYDRVVPLCEEPGALGRIQTHFAEKEGRFWNSALQIVGFEKIREIAFHPWPDATIPRRFCSATALVSDGHKRRVYYSIAEDLGMIGLTYGVEWCVVGLDRNWAYNPGCRMARP
ncbi:MAG TPA: hypothetical protein VHA77_18915 [Xanthobacteraceae bacterium]|jgi:hypothetical protein|nr:hypothetical protein [Xanthobacteraceae bacterium]